MASEVVKLTAQIVMSHASITELTPTELITEIKEIYEVLASLGIGEQLAEPKEYYQRYGLDRKKYPLVCKEYSAQRRKLAIDKGLGSRAKRKVTKPA
ncbi:MAG: MucR family transcriptional regulator [Syntrophobacterales bacterium]